MIRLRRRGRRSFILIAVLVVVGSALLVTTSLVFLSQSQVAALSDAGGTAQSRALAWSGAQVVMTRLDEQRREILDARLPRLDRQYVIYETGSRLGVVRLLPVTPDGRPLAPQAAALDLRHVDAEMLAATGLVDETLAGAIIAHRDGVLGGGFQSVGELLQVPGMTPARLYGPLEDLTVMDDASFEEGDIVERVAGRLGGTSPRGLADVVTVYGVEPAVQRNGDLRINLNAPWSDELGSRLDRRFGPGSGQFVKQIVDNGERFQQEARIFAVLNAFDIEPEEWPDIVDAVTTEPGPLHFGRLDINTAPLEALQALPEIEPEQAAGIVRAREGLSVQERATVAWPVVEGILPPEAYERLGGLITTRSWTFRLRLAAGEVSVEDPEGPLDHPLIYEVVVDCSAPQARLAYLRDVTLLQTTALLAGQIETEPEEDEDRWPEDEPEDDIGLDEDDPDSAPLPMDDGPPEDEDPLPPLPDDDLATDPEGAAPPPDDGSPPAMRPIGRWRGGR